MNARHALQKALAAFHAGHFSQTEALCRRVLKAHRDQPDASHLLGVVALQQGNYQTAVDFIEKALRKSPDNVSFQVNLGEAYRGLGRLDHAVSMFERALAIDPDRAEAHCGLGNTHLALEKIDQALTCFGRAIQINPNLAQAHYNNGNAHSLRGDTDEAISAYRRAISIKPTFADAHFNLGNLLSAKGEQVAAATAYEAALNAAPHFAKAWYNLGNALRKLGRLEGARQAYTRAIELDSSLTGAHVHLGTIAKRQGRLDAAHDELDRAIESDPDDPLAHSEKAHVLLLQGKTKEAIAGYQHAVDLAPRFAWGFMGLSSALAQDGRSNEANDMSQRAVRSRRTFDWPFLGRRPIGRVLVLKGVEKGHFKIGPDDMMALADAGMNSIDEHFDRSKFLQTSFYVDGIEPGTERGALPTCDVIFNAISDIDAMPLSHKIAKRISRSVSTPIVNHPDIVEQTQRHTNYEALRDIDGVVFPKTIHVTSRPPSLDQVDALIAEADMRFPVLARRTGTHVSESLSRVHDVEQLGRYFREAPEGPFYITEFIDYASERGAYIAMRMHFIDGKPYPTRLLINDDWLIIRHNQVKDLMAANQWMLEEATRFSRDPESYLGPRAFRTIASIHDHLPLDYFGVDFAQLADGRILIFEANATMFLPSAARNASGSFAYRKPVLEAMERALQDLLEKKIAEIQ